MKTKPHTKRKGQRLLPGAPCSANGSDSKTTDEIIGPGICDGCGEQVKELLVINHRGVAGLCGCKKCIGEKNWPNY